MKDLMEVIPTSHLIRPLCRQGCSVNVQLKEVLLKPCWRSFWSPPSCAPITYTAGEEGRALFQKATNVADDTVIGESIKRTTDVWPHLFEVLLPVATYDLQPAKARDVLIRMGSGMKGGYIARYLCQQ